MPWVQGSDSSLSVLLLHPHTLVMWSAEEESCHQSVPGPSEQGRSTGGSSDWPTFSLSQHLKVSSWSATAEPDGHTKTSLVLVLNWCVHDIGWLSEACSPSVQVQQAKWNMKLWGNSILMNKENKKWFIDWMKSSPTYPSENAWGNLITRLSTLL